MRSLPRLYEMMLEVFPQLAGTRVSHAWNGFVAYTFDELPHTGTHDGVHYAMGYCGSGISLSHYFGHRAGQRILGLAEGRTALDNIPFQTRPLYAGRPWFLKPAMAWYSLKDRLAGSGLAFGRHTDPAVRCAGHSGRVAVPDEPSRTGAGRAGRADALRRDGDQL